MSEKRGVYEKKIQFARMFLVGFERSKMRVPELFDVSKKAGCRFVHHCFYAFGEIFGLDERKPIDEMSDYFKQMPHIRDCLLGIANSRKNRNETVANVIEAGRVDETRVSLELSDYTVWMESLDADIAKKSETWLVSHPVSIGAWLLLFLSENWWNVVYENLKQRKFPKELREQEKEELEGWKNSMLLTYRIATEAKFSESDEIKKKIAEHETIKRYMTRIALVYPKTMQILNNLVSKLEPLAKKPELGQATLKRIYLEYQFLGQGKGENIKNDTEQLRTWVINSFERMSQGQDPKDAPAAARASEVQEVIQNCYTALEQHWKTPLIRHSTNFDNEFNQQDPQQKHLDFALRIDSVIAQLELPKEAIQAILGIYDMVTGQRFIDTPVFAGSGSIIQLQTPATQFERLLEGWKALSQRLEQPVIGMGWFSEFFDLMAELEDDELEQILPNFATENPTE